MVTNASLSMSRSGKCYYLLRRELNLKERFSVTITDEELADFSSKALYAEYYSVKSNGGSVDSEIFYTTVQLSC